MSYDAWNIDLVTVCRNQAPRLRGRSCVDPITHIEPYAKSLAYGFHEEEIALERQRTRPEQVSFEPFVGVAPRLYLLLFTMTQRKQSDGSRTEWNKASAVPRLLPPLVGYLQQEGTAGDGLLVALEKANLELENHASEA